MQRPLDDTEKTWYEKGMELGNAASIGNLGFLYEKGHGVKQSYVQSLMWYQKAAEPGDADAMGNLGWQYQYGHGTKVDLDMAKMWYEKGAAAGNAYSKERLETL